MLAARSGSRLLCSLLTTGVDRCSRDHRRRWPEYLCDSLPLGIVPGHLSRTSTLRLAFHRTAASRHAGLSCIRRRSQHARLAVGSHTSDTDVVLAPESVAASCLVSDIRGRIILRVGDDQSLFPSGAWDNVLRFYQAGNRQRLAWPSSRREGVNDGPRHFVRTEKRRAHALDGAPGSNACRPRPQCPGVCRVRAASPNADMRRSSRGNRS